MDFLGVVPQRIHLFEVRLGGSFAALAEQILDDLEALLEPQRRVDQRVLGVDVDLASEVHGREQEIAELGVHLGRRLFGDRLADLFDLLFHLVERALPARPVEADLAAPRAELLRARECRTGRHAVEHALGLLAARRFLGLFDLVPLGEHLLRGVDALLCREHVRVAMDELVADALHDRVDIERALAAPDRGLKHDLHQKIAELLAVTVDVVARERVEDLVGFFDEERAQRVERLLAVPRAAIGSEQAVHDFDEPG